VSPFFVSIFIFEDTALEFQAVEILNGRLQHEVIKTGFQYGGLCTKFEIEKVGSFA
jgi:hypothetical protein